MTTAFLMTPAICSLSLSCFELVQKSWAISVQNLKQLYLLNSYILGNRLGPSLTFRLDSTLDGLDLGVFFCMDSTYEKFDFFSAQPFFTRPI